MKIVQPPDYTGEKGKLGERFYNWLLKIPVIGDIILSIFAHKQWLDRLTTTADKNTLLYYALCGSPDARQAAEQGLQERYPDVAGEQSAVGAWLSQARSNPSEKLGETLRSAFSAPLVTELSEIAGSAVFDSIMSMAIGGAEKLTPDLQERIRRFLGTTVLLSTAPKVAGSLSEILSVGAVKTVGDVFRDAYFNLGLGFVTWQMTSPLIDAGIGQDLRKQSNLVFRPARFDWTQVKDLYALGEIDYNAVRQHLAEQGWRDQDIDKIARLAYRNISEGSIMGMWQENLIDQSECARRLRILGYSPDDITLVMQYAQVVKANAQKDILLSTARKAFKESLIGEPRFREILGQLNWSEEAIELEIAVASLEMSEDQRSLSAAQLKEAFLNNVITDVEASKALLELKFRSDEVPILIETWKLAKAPIVLRVNMQTILQALTRGVLSEPEARNKLAEIGYPATDVDLIIRTAYAQGLQTKPRVGVPLLIEGVRSNVINVSQLIDDLRTRGYPEFDINVIAGIAERQPAIGLSSKNILDAFMADVIDRVTAGAKLIELGMSPATAELQLDTAEAQREQARPEASLGLIMGLAANGLMSIADLRSLLTARKYSHTDIELIIAATEYQPPTPLSRDIIVKAYKEGVLNRDDALNRLLTLNFAAEDAQIILQTAEKEMTVTQARPSVTTYVAATRDGILTVQELRRKLLALGLAEDDAELFVQLATFKPAAPAKSLTKAEVIAAYKEFMYTRVDALRRLETLGYALEDADILLRMVRREPQDSEVHPLYQAGIITLEQAAISFAALGYTEDQITYYFEHYTRAE